MTHSVNDGLALVQATGQKVRDGVGAAATGIRDEMGVVAHGIREEIDEVRRHEPAAHKRKLRKQRGQREQSTWLSRVVKLTASITTAAAAFFVSRLVRSRNGRQGR